MGHPGSFSIMIWGVFVSYLLVKNVMVFPADSARPSYRDMVHKFAANHKLCLAQLKGKT